MQHIDKEVKSIRYRMNADRKVSLFKVNQPNFYINHKSITFTGYLRKHIRALDLPYLTCGMCNSSTVCTINRASLEFASVSSSVSLINGQREEMAFKFVKSMLAAQWQGG